MKLLGRRTKHGCLLGFLAVSLVLPCVISLSACGAGQKATQSAPQPTVIKICLRGAASGLDRVLTALYAQMDDTNQFRLEFTLVPAAKYQDELNRILTSKEDYNLVFDAPWISLKRLSDQRAYQNVSAYFDTADYPALQTAFPADYLKANRVNGRMDAIPITNTYWDPQGIFYRKDLLHAYGLGFDRISTKEQLVLFYEAVRQYSPDVIPLSLASRGFFDLNLHNMALREQQTYEVPGWAFYAFPSRIVLDESGKDVLDVVFAGDDPARFAALGKGFEGDFITRVFADNAALVPFVQENSVFAADRNDLFFAGKSASMEGALGLGGSVEVQSALRQRVSQGEVGFWCYDDSVFTATDGAKIHSNMQAWNFLCVPSYSTKTQDTMRFLNWLYADRSRLELFQYGVPEIDWLPQGENEYVMLTNGTDPFSFPSYELAWSPMFHRIERTLPEDEKRIQRLIYDTNSYVQVPLARWSLNTAAISIELAQLNALYKEYYAGFSHGAYGRKTQDKVKELYERAQALGLETVRAEIVRQAQMYLDTQ